MQKELFPMLQQNKSKGFFTIAQNNNDTDYVRLAYGLALSLKHSQSKVSNVSIGITPGTVVDDRYAWAFDNIIEIPWEDDAANSVWKLENEWKSAYMSPYYETIKLDSDMLFLSDIASWWEWLEACERDYIFTNTVLNWRGETISDDFYRKVFTKNNLPNIYTGFFYFKKSDETYKLFSMAKMIFWNWQRFFEEFFDPNHRPTYPSTDVIFALALKILDMDQHSYTSSMCPTFTHMKTQLQGWSGENLSENWLNHMKIFFNDLCELKIGNHRQLYPLHYHIKDALTDDIIRKYEVLVKNV